MTSDAGPGDVLIEQGVGYGLGKRADVDRPRWHGPATPLSPDGRSPIDDVAVTRTEPVPFRLVHGTRDHVLAVSESRDFAAR